MNYEIIVKPTFQREAKRLAITAKGKGKSGGARVITFTLVVSQQDAILNLLYIYDKADRASISDKEIEQLLKQNGLK